MSHDDFLLSLQMEGVPVAKCTVAKRDDAKYDHIVVRRADGSIADSFFYDRSTGAIVDAMNLNNRPPSPSADSSKSVASVDKKAPVAVPMKRGRGRPKLSPYQSRPNAASKSPSPKSPSLTYSNEPHSFEIGDFVVAKDVYCAEEPFPIYNICLGNMLKKYEPVMRGEETMHESTSRFLAYKNVESLATSYKPIKVNVLTCRGKTPDVVQITKECLPPKVDESLESSQTLYFFKIYIQCLISQSMDGSFFDTVKGQTYFRNSLEQIDHLLSECGRLIRSSVSWDEKVIDSLERLPFFKVEELDLKDRKLYPKCEASKNGSLLANRVLTLSGPMYEAGSLANLSVSCQRIAYLVNDKTLETMLTYHAVRHFKYQTYLESAEEIKYVATKHADNVSVMEGCLNNALWIQQTFKKLSALARKCNIEFEISEEDQQEWGSRKNEKKIKMKKKKKMKKKIYFDHFFCVCV